MVDMSEESVVAVVDRIKKMVVHILNEEFNEDFGVRGSCSVISLFMGIRVKE
jgi:hypothetical protein